MKRYLDISRNIFEDFANQITTINTTSHSHLPLIVPTSTNSKLTVNVSFRFQQSECKFSIIIPQNIYEGAKKSNKQLLIPLGGNENKINKEYFEALIFDPQQKEVYKSLLAEFRKFRSIMNLDDNEYLELLSAYVQNLDYDHEKRNEGILDPRFPIETLIDGKGICSDKSILLAGLLTHEGYAISLMSFKKETHMTVGIPVTKGYDYQNSGYAIIESTALSYIGDSSGEFGAGNRLLSIPEITQIGPGIKRYNKMNEITFILQTQRNLENQIKIMSKELSDTAKLNSSMVKEVEKYNAYVKLFNFIILNKGDRKSVMREIENNGYLPSK